MISCHNEIGNDSGQMVEEILIGVVKTEENTEKDPFEGRTLARVTNER